MRRFTLGLIAGFAAGYLFAESTRPIQWPRLLTEGWQR